MFRFQRPSDRSSSLWSTLQLLCELLPFQFHWEITLKQELLLPPLALTPLPPAPPHHHVLYIENKM